MVLTYLILVIFLLKNAKKDNSSLIFLLIFSKKYSLSIKKVMLLA